MTDDLQKKRGWKPPPVELRTTFGGIKVVDRVTHIAYLDIPYAALLSLCMLAHGPY